MNRTTIKSENYDLIALAACQRDYDAVASIGMIKKSFSMYEAYAACYATKPKDWQKKYSRINKVIRRKIRQYIDSGKYAPNYRRSPAEYTGREFHNRLPKEYTVVSSPVKEEAPVAVQQKLPFQSPGGSEKQALSSRNVVDLLGIIKQMLDKSMEETKTLRAFVEKIKIS